MKRTFIFPVAVIVSVLVLAILTKAFFPQMEESYKFTYSIDQIHNYAMSTGAMIIAALTFVPAEIVAISNGMIYGPVLGFTLTWIGALLGASIAFFASRILGRTVMAKMLGEKRLTLLDNWIKRYGLALFFIARLIPVIPFFLLNYGAGLTNIHFGYYLAITGIGIIPMTLLCVIFGDGITQSDWQAAMLIFSITLALIATTVLLKRRK